MPVYLGSSLVRTSTACATVLILYIIKGHSERRTLFGESSDFVAQKTCAAIKAGLKVILCIGETLQQREAGETDKINEAQLVPVIATLKPEDWKSVLLIIRCTKTSYKFIQEGRHRLWTCLGHRDWKGCNSLPGTRNTSCGPNLPLESCVSCCCRRDQNNLRW